MKSALLYNLLTRLSIKASHGQPLHLSEAEAALYAGADNRLRHLLAGLRNGDALAELLQRLGGVPDSFVRIIRTGEQSGKLAESLKATLDRLPLHDRLGFQGWMLHLYLSMNLGVLLLFLLTYAAFFRQSYSALFGSDRHFAGIYGIFLALGHPAAILVGVILLALALLFRARIQDLLFRLLPPLALNRRRLLSLELETRYLLSRSSGHPPDHCLEELVADPGTAAAVNGLVSAVSAIRNGETVTAALDPVIAASGLEAFCSIAVAEATPDPVQSLTEQTALVSGYLKEHLADELAGLFRWASVVCGVVVGAVIIFTFKSILHSYTLLEYLP